ncbi:Metallo-hydrolase/oxidoreductase [Neoconidiobolus thromboides FSU 785]|nr:Metallo-hydrolase/oxidoreductase [Neoconidiobolus thromboides FSU 785]
MKANLKVIGSGSGLDSSSSLMCFFDNKRYLFNCGESSQRLNNELGVKIVRYEHVFISRVEWECMGGLPGFILTGADGGKRELNIHGPKNLTHSIASLRHFIGRPNIQLNIHEIDNNTKVFQDENLKIEQAIILPEGEKEIDLKDDKLKQKIDLVDQFFKLKQDNNSENINKRIKLDNSQSPLINGVLTNPIKHNSSISYIATCNEVPGKFDPQAAIKLGLKPGPIYKELKAGNKVQNDKGEWILPEQCVGPSKKGSVFIVIDCKDLSYVNNLKNHEKFKKYINNKEDKVDVIYHNLGIGVISDERYQLFMSSFGPQCHHIISSKEVCPPLINFNYSAQNQLALNQLDKGIYNLPYHHTNYSQQYNINNQQLAYPGLEYQLEPVRKATKTDDKVYLDLTNEKNQSNQVLNKLKEYQEFIKKEFNNDIKEKEDNQFISNGPFISTLGTGSAVPSLTRNVSSNLITLKNKKMMLLDCGEGTLGQIYRHLGENQGHSKIRQNYKDFLINLRCIYISHPHADHHLGVISVMKSIHEYYKENNLNNELFYIAPYSLYLSLKEHSMTEEFGFYRWKFINTYNLILENNNIKPEYQQQIDNLLVEMEFKEITTCIVPHCQHSFGISFITKDNFKLVYSGDTRPSDNLVQIGKEADVLIHEATMDDELAKEAKAKRHSTISEAIEQGKKMQVKNIVLTHFSQRYSSFTKMDRFKDLNVLIGSDLMCLDFNENSKDSLKFQKFIKAFLILDNCYQKIGYLNQEFQ